MRLRFEGEHDRPIMVGQRRREKNRETAQANEMAGAIHRGTEEGRTAAPLETISPFLLRYRCAPSFQHRIPNPPLQVYCDKYVAGSMRNEVIDGEPRHKSSATFPPTERELPAIKRLPPRFFHHNLLPGRPSSRSEGWPWICMRDVKHEITTPHNYHSVGS